MNRSKLYDVCGYGLVNAELRNKHGQASLGIRTLLPAKCQPDSHLHGGFLLSIAPSPGKRQMCVPVRI